MTKFTVHTNTGIVMSGARRFHPPSLRVVEGAKSLRKVEPRSAPDPDDFERAFEVLQATLTGETWFIETIRQKMLDAEAERPKSAEDAAKPAGYSYPTLATRMWHNHLIQMVQFLFLLEALECTQPDQIRRFVDRHNQKVQRDIESGTHAVSAKELKRAIFTPVRKEQLAVTFGHYNRPVFSAFELGYLLIDIMSPKTTENILVDLKLAGLVRVRGGKNDPFDPPIGTDPRRELLEPSEVLVDTYRQSLLMTRDAIL